MTVIDRTPIARAKAQPTPPREDSTEDSAATVWQPSTIVGALMIQEATGKLWSCPATANGWSKKVPRNAAIAVALREIPALSAENARRVLLAIGAPCGEREA